MRSKACSRACSHIAVEIGGGFGGLRWNFQITDFAVGHVASVKEKCGRGLS